MKQSDKVANKISLTLGILNKLKHVLPVYTPCTLKTMYGALIAPYFNYNILLWGFNSNRMSTLQKKAIRIITCAITRTQNLYLNV